MKVRTNFVPRDVIDASELSAQERAEFDYLDWPAIEAGRESASFFRYRGDLYDLGNFIAGNGVGDDSGLPESLTHWDGHMGDSYFSATLVRYVNDNQQVIVGVMTT